ncbi:MAG: hypothetical protein R3D29_08375 [Nitratireductor sp.]
MRCATIGSLAPLASAGRVAGIETPATTAMITLASRFASRADVELAGRGLTPLASMPATLMKHDAYWMR